MGKTFFLTAILGSLSFASFAPAATITAENDIRTGSKYYVRYDYMTLEKVRRVGLDSIPGYWDEEGYCTIDVEFSLGNRHLVIQKGEVLDVVGEKTRSRTVTDWRTGLTKEVTDTWSTLRFSDGVIAIIGCSLDAAASETEPYKPVTDISTKAYLTALDLFFSESR